ncbi:MAG: hypothetical protein ACFFDI_29475 [Promethearchaeota archaeon]
MRTEKEIRERLNLLEKVYEKKDLRDILHLGTYTFYKNTLKWVLEENNDKN